MSMEIIPGLPEDIGIQCLARVPYEFHNRLRGVCQSWNDVLSSDDFYQERQSLDMCEDGIASLQRYRGKKGDFGVIIYYPVRNRWESLPPIPEEFNLQHTKYHQCVYVKSQLKLVVMGLVNRERYKPKVLIFDFVIRKWKMGKDMPGRSRCFFACAVSPDGLVYIAGGRRRVEPVRHQPQGMPALREALVYNVQENKWRFLRRMNRESGASLLQNHCLGAFVEDKFLVVNRENSSAQVYDPNSQVWRSINSIPRVKAVHKCVASAADCGRIYLFDWDNVKEWDVAHNFSTTVEKLIRRRLGAVLCVTVWRDSVFVTTHSETTKMGYYLFEAEESEWEKRWSRIEMPKGFPSRAFRSSAAAVHF